MTSTEPVPQVGIRPKPQGVWASGHKTHVAAVSHTHQLTLKPQEQDVLAIYVGRLEFNAADYTEGKPFEIMTKEQNTFIVNNWHKVTCARDRSQIKQTDYEYRNKRRTGAWGNCIFNADHHYQVHIHYDTGDRKYYINLKYVLDPDNPHATHTHDKYFQLKVGENPLVAVQKMLAAGVTPITDPPTGSILIQVPQYVQAYLDWRYGGPAGTTNPAHYGDYGYAYNQDLDLESHLIGALPHDLEFEYNGGYIGHDIDTTLILTVGVLSALLFIMISSCFVFLCGLVFGYFYPAIPKYDDDRNEQV